MSKGEKSRHELVRELASVRERVAELERVAAEDGPEERQRHQDVLRAMHALLLETDPDGRLRHVSPNVTELLGYEASELIGLHVRDWVHPDDLERLGELQRKVLSSGEGARARWRARHKAGHWVGFESSDHPYHAAERGIRLLSFAREVTTPTESGEALRESEPLLRAIGTRAAEMVTVFDDDGRFLYVSPNRERLLGHSPEVYLGRTIREIQATGELYPTEGESMVESFERLRTGRPRDRLEYRLRHADGSWRWIESTGTSYQSGDGSKRIVILSRDVTERVQAEQRLRENEARYRVVVEATGNLVSETDAEGRLVYVSGNCEQVLGFTRQELTGTTPLALLIHPDDAERCAEEFLGAVRDEKPAQIRPYRVRRRDGTWRWFETMSVPYRPDEGEAHVLGVSRDVTERIRSEEQRRELSERMQQTQRLESLGVMAGGIAHDFNNLLTPILGDSSLALQDLPEDSPARDQLRRIRRAAQRAAGLTHQMLAYAGRGPLVIESLDLSRLVIEMGQLLETAAAGRAVLNYEMAAEPPLVDGDATQLSQVALNLISNASEAIDGKKGRIWIRTGSVAAEEVSRAALFPGRLEDGPYVYFEVEDDGCGMDDETRARIFDPFFTTKFTGRGLGLAAVLGIVRGHGGAIELRSAPGEGTRFRVLLPARSESPSLPTPDSGDSTDWRGSGTVLVVDDDDGVRELAGETLRRAGLSVLSARDGEEAVAIFRRHAARIDAVLLDRTMPGTSGEETFAALREIRADAPVILMSGYSKERAAEHFGGGDLAGFLQKPFLPATLLSRVREVQER